MIWEIAKGTQQPSAQLQYEGFSVRFTRRVGNPTFGSPWEAPRILFSDPDPPGEPPPASVSYTHLRAHETSAHL
eukprot:5658578-Alexandrium_andersonii.AAC.1